VAVGDTRPSTAAPERSLGLAGSLIKGRYRVNAVSSVSRDVVVYTAEDVRYGRPIALKVLRDECASDSQFVAAVRGQAGTMAMFAHVLRGVARVYECDATDSGELFAALEWTEGTTVREVLDTCGALAPATALRVAIRVGEALEALHHHQIVHGQLGPDSVLMVTDSDGVERVKLLGVELTAAYRTPIGLGLRDALPPAYRAPEQIERGETTESTDVYALGMLLRELLTAARAGETTGALTARPPLPPPIERIITTALDAQPERRYPDISVMVNDMWGATTGLAEPEPRARSVKPPADPHRRELRRRPHFTLRTIAIVVTAGIFAVLVWVAAFDRIASRLQGRVTPSAVTVVPAVTDVPVDRDATPPPVSPGAPSSASATREETSTPPESRAVEEASAAEEPATVVAKPLVAPVIVREPVTAPAAGRSSGPAVESRTPPAPRAQAERPPRRDRADTDVGDGSAAIDWLLQNRR
jgi:serine/threonine protein kinase